MKPQHDTGASCACISDHRPAPLEFEIHHIWPLGMDGPDAAWNREWLCPTAHTNAHELLRAMVKEMRDIPLSEFSARYAPPVSRWAHHVASVGFQRWVAHLNGADPSAIPLRSS